MYAETLKELWIVDHLKVTVVGDRTPVGTAVDGFLSIRRQRCKNGSF